MRFWDFVLSVIFGVLAGLVVWVAIGLTWNLAALAFDFPLREWTEDSSAPILSMLGAAAGVVSWVRGLRTTKTPAQGGG